MNKMFYVLLAVLLIGAVFFSGCTQGQITAANTQGVKITSDSDAAKAMSDVSSGISGVKNSLNQIDQNLTSPSGS